MINVDICHTIFSLESCTLCPVVCAVVNRLHRGTKGQGTEIKNKKNKILYHSTIYAEHEFNTKMFSP